MKKSKLPKTDSIQELADFWDTHDLTDFEIELKNVVEPVFVKRCSICPTKFASTKYQISSNPLLSPNRSGRTLMRSSRAR